MPYKYELATIEDGEEISALLEDVDFEGEISIAYARRPNAVQSLAKDGNASAFVIARDEKTGKIVGVGACVIKNNIAYLTGLRSKKRVNIPKSYAILRAFCEANNVKLTYTTILDDNIGVQRMLEKQRPSMPNYLRHSECIVHIIRKKLKIKDRNLLITDGGYYILKNPQKKEIARCKAAQQWDHKQYIVKRYGWKMRLAKKILRWIPNENEVLKFFTLVGVKADDATALESLLRHISNIDLQGSFFLYGGIDVRCPVKSFAYKSIVYIVDWDKTIENAANITFELEIADL